MACTFMMEYIRNNLFLPGQVENWIILIDLDNLGLMSVPYKVEKKPKESLINHIEHKRLHGDSIESVSMHIFKDFYP